MNTNPGAVGPFRKLKDKLAVIDDICCKAKSPACLKQRQAISKQHDDK
jgi:hypothetical protein